MHPMDFIQRTSAAQVAEGTSLAQRFHADGLVPVVTTDQTTGEVLMMGVMTAKALRLTIKAGTAHYWSRSRRCLWHKGATSGLVQRVVEARIDDDRDAVRLRVKVSGGASCHVGYRSALQLTVPMGQAGPLRSVGHVHGITGPLHGGLHASLHGGLCRGRQGDLVFR